MASPQKENGYTPIANELLEALAGIRIPGEARQCLDVIIRKTYGWGKTDDIISLSQFALITHMGKTHILIGLRKLEEMKILVIQKGNVNGNKYKFYKDFDRWRPLPKKVIVTQKGNGVTQKGNESLPKKVHTIDNLQKTQTQKKAKPDPNRHQIPPSLEMVAQYCLERANGIDPKNFMDVNDGKGWMYGKTKMKDWQAVVRTWERMDWNKNKASSDPIEQEILALVARSPEYAWMRFAAKHDEDTILKYMHLFPQR
jgi:phage replication O-like protein O